MSEAARIPEEPTPKYNEDDLKAAVFELYADGKGMTFTAMAKEAGIAFGSFSNWKDGRYGSPTQKIAGQVSQWLAARGERQATLAKIADAPRYVETPTALHITTLLTFAQSSPDIVIAAAGPGVGKTTALMEYSRRHPNVIVITGRTSLRSAFNLLGEIAIVMGIEERLTSRLNRAIGAKLKGKRGLIIVDEAQHLAIDAMEELRSLHDLWDCGLALIGSPKVYARIEGKSRDGDLAQLFSRVGMRMTQARPRAEDVTALASAWGIIDPKVMRLVQRIAARPGALRVLTKTLKLASIVAAGDGSDPLSEAAITKAFNQLGDALVT